MYRKSSSLVITGVYYAAYIGLGLAAASLGPSLPSLAARTHVQLKQASLLFTAVNLGYLIGALWGGRIFDRRAGHPAMIGSLLFTAVMLAIIPIPTQLAVLIVVMLLVGGSQAFLDVGGNTLLVWLHREKVSPFMNGLHLFWGVGSILSPILIAQAILLTGNFAWGFWIIAAILLPVAWAFKGLPSPTAPHQEPGAEPQKATDWPLVILFVLFFTAFVATESSYGGWIYSYAIATKIALPATAAVMTSVYWGALTLSRLVSIPLALRFRPRTLLIANMVGCLVGLSLAVIGGSSPGIIWLATVVLGASVASFFPVSLSFARETITITGQFTSLMFVGASLGGMLLPWLIGQFFETAGPHSAMVIMLGDMVVCCGIFIILMALKKSRSASENPART
jgi:MFS transporter, FHS family, Na+ dependent glucose transporter 1